MNREETCGKCNGTGWVTIVKDDADFAQRCDCQQMDQFLTKCRHANIPQRFLTAKLENFFPDTNFPSQEKVKKIVKKFIDNYPPDIKGLLMQGAVGVGKTRLLCTIATELIKKNNRIDVYYIDWNDFTRELRASFGQYEITNQFIAKLSTVDLLLFDELGASNTTPWILDNIYYIFNKRYNDQKMTLAATNYLDNTTDSTDTFSRQESLSQRIGERIRSRLYEMMETVIISGKDMRKEYK